MFLMLRTPTYSIAYLGGPLDGPSRQVGRVPSVQTCIYAWQFLHIFKDMNQTWYEAVGVVKRVDHLDDRWFYTFQRHGLMSGMDPAALSFHNKERAGGSGPPCISCEKTLRICTCGEMFRHGRDRHVAVLCQFSHRACWINCPWMLNVRKGR